MDTHNVYGMYMGCVRQCIKRFSIRDWFIQLWKLNISEHIKEGSLYGDFLLSSGFSFFGTVGPEWIHKISQVSSLAISLHLLSSIKYSWQLCQGKQGRGRRQVPGKY